MREALLLCVIYDWKLNLLVSKNVVWALFWLLNVFWVIMSLVCRALSPTLTKQRNRLTKLNRKSNFMVVYQVCIIISSRSLTVIQRTANEYLNKCYFAVLVSRREDSSMTLPEFISQKYIYSLFTVAHTCMLLWINPFKVVPIEFKKQLCKFIQTYYKLCLFMHKIRSKLFCLNLIKHF